MIVVGKKFETNLVRSHKCTPNNSPRPQHLSITTQPSPLSTLIPPTTDLFIDTSYLNLLYALLPFDNTRRKVTSVLPYSHHAGIIASGGCKDRQICSSIDIRRFPGGKAAFTGTLACSCTPRIRAAFSVRQRRSILFSCTLACYDTKGSATRSDTNPQQF